MAPSLVSPVLVGRQAELESLSDGLERALVEMMRELAGELTDQPLDAVLGPARAKIGRLVPELGDSSPGPAMSERVPSALLELMVGMIARLTGDAPLMLVFEDLQWADGPTLDLLALLARAAVHDDLLPGERAQLHRSYAEAIERTADLAGDLDASSMLAHHWLAAHDSPRSLPASVRAGRAAAAALVPSAAQRHFELALELWSQVPDAEEGAGIDHVELLAAAAVAASRAGAAERALALVDEALGEMGDHETLERRVPLLIRRGELLGDLGRDDEGLAVLEQAVGLGLELLRHGADGLGRSQRCRRSPAPSRSRSSAAAG